MTKPLIKNINCDQEIIELNDQRFYAHPTGALIWQEQATLIISDLYLRSGLYLDALNQTDSKTQVEHVLNSIKNLITSYDIKQVIAIGQGFRRIDDPFHITNQDMTTLYYIQKHVKWIWVIGAMASQLPHRVGGLRLQSYDSGGFHFRAKPIRKDVGNEIAGGLFPMAKVTSNDQNYALPCFVYNHKRMIMPAFGGKACAKNILNQDYIHYFGHDHRKVQLITNNYTLPVSHRRLVA